MNRIFIILAIISTLLLTALVGVKKPSLNKPVAINNGQIIAQIKEQQTVTQEAQVKPVSTPNQDMKVAPVEAPTQKVTPKVTTVNPPQTKKETTKPAKKEEKKSEPKVTKQPEPKKVEPKPEPKVEPKKEPIAEPITEPTETPTPTKKKVLTEEEEIIAWNKWRSEIQNELMRNYNVPAPLGTTYKFSFTVDKWGNLSNVSVGCETSFCPQAGTTDIRLAIPKLYAKGLLKFPEGTQRIMTAVNGGFVIVDTAYQFSTPEDYSDYEKIKRQVEK